MIRNLIALLSVSAVLITAGCESQQTFDVIVTNRMSDPISVWMTKAKPVPGNKYEPGWMPPEVVAVGNTSRLGGVAIDPGTSVHTTVKGTIANNDVAVLRVYHAVELNAILAIGRGSPDRLDIPLDPGKTDIDIVKKDGQMASVPHVQK